MVSPAGRSADLELPLQAFWLRRAFPHSFVALTARRLLWRAEVQPLPTTERYVLELVATRSSMPTVTVLNPELVPDREGQLPHVYDDGSLCVSRAEDWRPHLLFVDSILPWALEWLIFYEIWRASGVWYGDRPAGLDAESQSKILHPYHAPLGPEVASVPPPEVRRTPRARARGRRNPRRVGRR